ncbi:MAG: four-carbon acid sugar kinase family protein [Lautropia sp.]|nr:four-carbon acid sugar kinase family protein [Lautropia sp.]
MLLGCIADDFTGASDLANTLTSAGMRTVQTIGVPRQGGVEADAVVVALKSRSIEPAEAVRQSLAALAWLQAHGAEQILFKYCSTFDSTPEGNIGPVAQALLDQLGARITVACPAFPTNRRTIYLGHLFVGERLLSESGMQHHPLTPMTDPDLVRWLQRQMPGKVALLDLAVVARGAAAVRECLRQLAADGVRVAVADAITDEHLRSLGEGCAELALITGGSGIALGLPENFRRTGRLALTSAEPVQVGGRAVVLSGSCSSATRAQVAAYGTEAPSRLVSAEEICGQRLTPEQVAKWVLEQPSLPAPMVYTSADPAAVAQAQEQYGAQQVAQAIESFTGGLAARLLAHGFRRFIVAGGETSGAVVQALGVRQLAIGPEIDPGVPALRGVDVPVGLALKSGNFGAADFFSKAVRQVG